MAKIKINDTRTIKILLLREELFAIRLKMDIQPPIQAFLSLLKNARKKRVLRASNHTINSKLVAA